MTQMHTLANNSVCHQRLLSHPVGEMTGGLWNTPSDVIAEEQSKGPWSNTISSVLEWIVYRILPPRSDTRKYSTLPSLANHGNEE